jgi:hypothetical protein
LQCMWGCSEASIVIRYWISIHQSNTT